MGRSTRNKLITYVVLRKNIEKDASKIILNPSKPILKLVSGILHFSGYLEDYPLLRLKKFQISELKFLAILNGIECTLKYSVNRVRGAYYLPKKKMTGSEQLKNLRHFRIFQIVAWLDGKHVITFAPTQHRKHDLQF